VNCIELRCFEKGDVVIRVVMELLGRLP
jgi:hypothetical protein